MYFFHYWWYFRPRTVGLDIPPDSLKIYIFVCLSSQITRSFICMRDPEKVDPRIQRKMDTIPTRNQALNWNTDSRPSIALFSHHPDDRSHFCHLERTCLPGREFARATNKIGARSAATWFVLCLDYISFLFFREKFLIRSRFRWQKFWTFRFGRKDSSWSFVFG